MGKLKIQLHGIHAPAVISPIYSPEEGSSFKSACTISASARQAMWLGWGKMLCMPSLFLQIKVRLLRIRPEAGYHVRARI